MNLKKFQETILRSIIDNFRMYSTLNDRRHDDLDAIHLVLLQWTKQLMTSDNISKKIQIPRFVKLFMNLKREIP
ncbi:hypothetical protein CAJAP_03484 [Camponotus japonicus]